LQPQSGMSYAFEFATDDDDITRFVVYKNWLICWWTSLGAEKIWGFRLFSEDKNLRSTFLLISFNNSWEYN
jgi:hypothetical protein